MQNLPEIKIRRRVVAASEQTIARRASVVERLDRMDHIDASTGELNTTETQWVAQIGDAEFVVLDFAVQKLDDGQVSISLVAIADKVSVGGQDVKPSPTEDEQAEDDRHQMVVDRLNFANQATLGEQVAQNVREQIQRSGGILA